MPIITARRNGIFSRVNRDAPKVNFEKTHWQDGKITNVIVGNRFPCGWLHHVVVGDSPWDLLKNESRQDAVEHQIKDGGRDMSACKFLRLFKHNYIMNLFQLLNR